jgi:ferrous iron transport protein B
MAILYRVEETENEEETRNVLRDRLAASKWPDGRPIFTPLSLVSLLVFFIYALQCLPTSAVVARESGSWKWATGQFFFMTGFAYAASLIVFQLGKLVGY